jgi:predicted RNase H-like HicB family nuclease
MIYPIVFVDGRDGFIVAEHRGLPGCISQGRTLSEALRNLADAIDSVEPLWVTSDKKEVFLAATRWKG